MKKILIITDAWEPQVNGVVTTMTTVVKHLKKKSFNVEVLHPGHFHTFPLPNYPEISIAWNFWELKIKSKKLNQTIFTFLLRAHWELLAGISAWNIIFHTHLLYIQNSLNMYMNDLVLV